MSEKEPKQEPKPEMVKTPFGLMTVEQAKQMREYYFDFAERMDTWRKLQKEWMKYVR